MNNMTTSQAMVELAEAREEIKRLKAENARLEDRLRAYCKLCEGTGVLGVGQKCICRYGSTLDIDALRSLLAPTVELLSALLDEHFRTMQDVRDTGNTDGFAFYGDFSAKVATELSRLRALMGGKE